MFVEDNKMKTTDHSVMERFLRYISYDTQSKEEEEQVPSTKKQLEFSIDVYKRQWKMCPPAPGGI